MIGKMLPGTGNSITEGVREVKEWTECDRCLGTGMVPHDVNNLDDERLDECPQCEGNKGYYITRLR